MGSPDTLIFVDFPSTDATILWRDHYWAEFNGFNSAFEDPWGNTMILWGKAGESPVIAEAFTSE